MDLKIAGRQKTEWALQRGGRSAHSFSWLLSSPQQPLETEDPPTVSLAPQYTSQHLCRAIINSLHWEMHEKWPFWPGSRRSARKQERNFFTVCKVRFSRSDYLRGLCSKTDRKKTADGSQDWSAPTSALIASARALACDVTSLSLSPSIMTRASDSVPEYRNNSRPRSPSCCSISRARR
jgi:hypothetical protein